MSYTRLLQLPRSAHFFLFGPRQVGKTTLIKNSFSPQTTLSLDLLNMDKLRQVSSNPSYIEEILRANKHIQYVVIDEVQLYPAILNEVHRLIESLSNPPKFILTGSSARKLRRSDANMLGGRAWNLSMFPLTYSEITQQESFALNKALQYGTLPAIYSETDEESMRMKLMSYVEIYLNEEVKKEALVRNLFTFMDFLRIAAENNGQIINYANVSQDLGLEGSTVKEYYQILEDTLLGFYLRPIGRSFRSKVIKHPKFYFFDTGVTRAICKQVSSSLDYGSQNYGHCFEHFLIKDLVHTAKYLQKDFEFSFYRNHSGSEVDLIIETPDKEIFAIEIKASSNPKKKDYAGLFSFAKLAASAKLICACQTKHSIIRDGVTIMPWQELYHLLRLEGLRSTESKNFQT
jgi:uncharacterized protein